MIYEPKVEDSLFLGIRECVEEFSDREYSGSVDVEKALALFLAFGVIVLGVSALTPKELELKPGNIAMLNHMVIPTPTPIPAQLMEDWVVQQFCELGDSAKESFSELWDDTMSLISEP